MSKSITQNEFKKAKDLKELDLTAKQISKILKRSDTTVSQMLKFETLNEYKDWTNKRLSKYKTTNQEAVETKPTKTVSEIQLLTNEVKQLRIAIYTLINSNSNKNKTWWSNK